MSVIFLTLTFYNHIHIRMQKIKSSRLFTGMGNYMNSEFKYIHT